MFNHQNQIIFQLNVGIDPRICEDQNVISK